MKPFTVLLLAPILWACTLNSHAATGSAETGDVTVDTRSDNADLSDLTLSSGTLDPAFASGTTAYTASVSHATTSLTVTPTRAEANATIEVRVNGGGYAAVASGSASAPLSLDPGSNTVDLRVTAQAGNTKTYTVTVTRLAPPTVTDPTATSITANTATLGGNVTADGGSAITERGVVWSQGSVNDDPFIGGGGVTKVVVSGTTGAFTTPVSGLNSGLAHHYRAYAINSEGTSYSPKANFTTLSTNANLSSLVLNSGTPALSPAFASGTTAYTADVVNAATSLTVTPTRAQANATIEVRVNGGSYSSVTSGSPSGSLALNVGSNTIDVRVTAQAGNTQTYTITVTRDKASQTITGFSNPGPRVANTTVNLSATSGGSNNPVTFTAEGPAAIDGNNVLSFTGTGSVTVRANQAGDANYHPAPEVAHTFTVTAASATVTLDDLAHTYDGTPKSATATTDPPGLSLSLVHDPASPLNAGDYAVSATVTDPRYSGSKSGTLVIAKAPQAIAFANPGTQFSNATVELFATGGASNNPVTFAVTDGPATLTDGTTLTFTGTGSVTVTASQAGNTNYEAAPEVAHTFEVTAATATVTLSRLHQVADGTAREVVVTTDPADLDVEVTYDGDPDAPTAPGSYAVAASSADARYEGVTNGTLVVEDPAAMTRIQGGQLPALSDLGALEVADFEIGRHEVTRSLWNTVRDWSAANGYDLAAIGAGSAGDHPVHSLNWHDALKWCNARTEWENATYGRSLAPVYRVGADVYRSGEPDPATILVEEGTSGYRLPTAMEWEFAARGGTSTTGKTHAGGNDPDLVAWHAGNSGGAIVALSAGRGTWPAGHKDANELGLHDFSGNVAEWTQTANPANPSTRFLLGGSWNGTIGESALGVLGGAAPASRLDTAGLRVARSVAAALAAALDHPSLTWRSGGDAAWFAQTGTTHDGTDAAESGPLSQGQSSWVETTVEGPGNLRFRWKTTGTDGLDVLAFALDGAPALSRSGTGDWEERLVEIGSGTHTLRWTLTRGSADGEARAWLDTVAHETAGPPTVTTATPTDLTTTGATLGGEVTADGGRTVTARGVVYGTAPDPTLENGTDLPAAVGGTGSFTVSATGLVEGTTYYARAYATNNLGTSYGNQVVFTTDFTVAFPGGIGTVTDRAILAGDRQVFRFTFTEARMVNFTGTGGTGLGWELRNTSNALVASGNGNVALARLLLAGNYALVLTNATATDATVSLNLDASVVAVSRPDVQVGPNGFATVGANRYTPLVQTTILTSRTALPVTGFARVGNDGTLPTVLRVFGTRSTTFFRVTYFGRLGTNPNANVTAQMNAGTYATPSLANTSAPAVIRAAVVPNRALLVSSRRVGTRLVTTTRRMTVNAVIRATSVSGPVRTDAATIRVNTQ